MAKAARKRKIAFERYMNAPSSRYQEVKGALEAWYRAEKALDNALKEAEEEAA